MMVTDEAVPVLVVRRQMAVPRERVFEAWLDSESLAHWMRPGDSTRTTVSVHARVGGAFRIVMEGQTHGAVEHRGEYLAIEPPSLLSFTWISKFTDQQPTLVTIEFHERGTGTVSARDDPGTGGAPRHAASALIDSGFVPTAAVRRPTPLQNWPS